MGWTIGPARPRKRPESGEYPLLVQAVVAGVEDEWRAVGGGGAGGVEAEGGGRVHEGAVGLRDPALAGRTVAGPQHRGCLEGGGASRQALAHRTDRSVVGGRRPLLVDRRLAGVESGG